ncbi:unnamed protein product [Hymenolepis diminuta]|uniref:Uncharacterized protein n=1 Tax=Hymenolepis diminuta TaxID=6216 RepID=A0A564XYK7_HYMDI|nr:unnamed protein product [Hymenolepis diminuta]
MRTHVRRGFSVSSHCGSTLMSMTDVLNSYLYAIDEYEYFSLSVRPRDLTKVSGLFSIYRLEFFVFPCHVNPKIISAFVG